MLSDEKMKIIAEAWKRAVSDDKVKSEILGFADLNKIYTLVTKDSEEKMFTMMEFEEFLKILAKKGEKLTSDKLFETNGGKKNSHLGKKLASAIVALTITLPTVGQVKPLAKNIWPFNQKDTEAGGFIAGGLAVAGVTSLLLAKLFGKSKQNDEAHPKKMQRQDCGRSVSAGSSSVSSSSSSNNANDYSVTKENVRKVCNDHFVVFLEHNNEFIEKQPGHIIDVLNENEYFENLTVRCNSEGIAFVDYIFVLSKNLKDGSVRSFVIFINPNLKSYQFVYNLQLSQRDDHEQLGFSTEILDKFFSQTTKDSSCKENIKIKGIIPRFSLLSFGVSEEGLRSYVEEIGGKIKSGSYGGKVGILSDWIKFPKSTT